MEDLKALTVRTLRELARKHLGKGHSKLKTKEELLTALKGLIPDLTQGPVAAAREVPARVVQFAKKALEATRERASGVGPVTQRPAEPLVEGFFVARVAGEGEARRHRLVEERGIEGSPPSNGHGYDERLGELPSGYGDDAAVLLPRDPGTLFFFWDFKEQTRAEAAAGLEAPRTVIRVFEGAQLLREVDFALESKSFYLHDLPPGRTYRAEAHFVGKDGRSKRVGRSSNVIALPPAGPSSNTTVRFLRVPWDAPLKHLRQWLKEGKARLAERTGPFEYLSMPRTSSPSSAELPAGRAGLGTPGAPSLGPLNSSSQRTWSSHSFGRQG